MSPFAFRLLVVAAILMIVSGLVGAVAGSGNQVLDYVPPVIGAMLLALAFSYHRRNRKHSDG